MINRSNNNHFGGERKDSLLPPVEMLEKYEELQIGKDLVNLVKVEQEHRHRLQNKYSNSHRLGQILSSMVFIYFIYEVSVLIRSDYLREACVISTLFFTMILGVALMLRTMKGGAYVKNKTAESFASGKFPYRRSGRK